MLSSQDKVVSKAHVVPVHGAYNLVKEIMHWMPTSTGSSHSVDTFAN